MAADVSERLVERRRRKPAPPRPDHFAAEAEPAIDRAGIDELEQHPVGVAVHDALDRAVRLVADRVMAFPGSMCNSRASGTNCRAIGSCGSDGSIRSASAGVMATA